MDRVVEQAEEESRKRITRIGERGVLTQESGERGVLKNPASGVA